MPSTSGNEKLIRCMTTNTNGERRLRYVEMPIFNLWRHLMESKHGLQVDDLCLCLWVDHKEYERNADLYGHAGDLEPLVRIEVAVFDETHRFTSEVIRFVPSEDEARTIAILRAHAADHLKQADMLEINTEPGYGIRQYQHRDSGSLELDLHSTG